MILVLIIYVLSVVAMYVYTSVYYNNPVLSENDKVDGSNVAMVFIPVLNTALALIMWTFCWPWRKTKMTLNEFFRIKS